MTGAALFERAAVLVDGLVHDIRDPGWSRPTCCAGWTVRGLVNHLVVENLWAAELFSGATVDEVGHRLDGDRLGAVPRQSWSTARAAARAAAGHPASARLRVHLSSGDVLGEEYAMQLFADHLVHAWDLARALDQAVTLPTDLVDTCAAWFAPHEDTYRRAGLIGPRPAVPDDAPPHHHLLAAFGRTP